MTNWMELIVLWVIAFQLALINMALHSIAKTIVEVRRD